MARSILPALTLALAGCFASSDPGPRLDPAPSYVATVDGVTLGETTWAPGWGTPETSGAIGLTLRLDPTVRDGSVVAVLTPRWGQPVTYRGRPDGDVVALAPEDGGAQLRGTAAGWATTTTIDRLVLEGDVGDGGILVAERATFTGIESVFMGDAGTSAPVEGSLVLRRDDEAPEARVTGGRRDGWLVPWEEVGLATAEPIAPEALLASLVAPGGEAVMTSPVAATVAPAGWWAPGPLAIDLASGYADPAGNGGTAASLDADVFGSNAPRAHFELIDASEVEVWGNAVPGAPADIGCELRDGSDGCVSVRREEHTYLCGAPGGLFARISSETPFRFVVVRARAVSRPSSFGGGWIDASDGAIHLEAAEVGSREIISSSAVLEMSLVEGGTSIAADSGWQTLEIDLGREVRDLGAALDLAQSAYGCAGGYGFAGGDYGGGPPFRPSSPVDLIIESISVR